ncbi:MAG: flagellar hook-basal body complex protein FliE [Methanotrichaceae archaeon]|nr:flagellar hook-basal body complex protein FliE [Methanotrichaceae archaeon]
MKLIGFVGMPGSGKSEASRVARDMGLAVVVMGDVIRSEAARLGLSATDENLGRVGNMLRAGEGPDVVARRTLDSAAKTGKELAVIDGLRSKAEADFFRAHSQQFVLVEVWTPPEARLQRVIARGRADDAKEGSNAESVLSNRDSRELGWGMNELINEADIRICNDGDLAQLQRFIKALLERIAAVS